MEGVAQGLGEGRVGGGGGRVTRRGLGGRVGRRKGEG